MYKKKVGIIGAGNIFETVHYKYFSRRSDCEIVALTDRTIEQAKNKAEIYGIPHYFKSAKEMLENVQLDIVCVCVPNKYHYENVMLALKHACHVLCEKPPSIFAKEAEEMMAFAKQKNKVLAYNLHWRNAIEVRLLKEKIDKGELGEIYNIKVNALRRLGIPGWGNFIDQSIQGGGPLIDIGVHMLDVALYLIGYPEIDNISSASYQKIGNVKDQGTLGHWNPENYTVEDSLFAFIKFKNGASLLLETSFALNIKEKSDMNVWLRGTDAGASVFPLEIYGDVNGELANTIFPSLITHDKQEITINNFLDACDGKNTMIADGVIGFKLQHLIEEIYSAANSNDTVTK